MPNCTCYAALFDDQGCEVHDKPMVSLDTAGAAEHKGEKGSPAAVAGTEDASLHRGEAPSSRSRKFQQQESSMIGNNNMISMGTASITHEFAIKPKEPKK